VIKSFRCKKTAKLFGDKDVPSFRAFERQARRRLLYLNQVISLDDLRIPPSNHLEALKGDRKEQFSIRINKKWRICFTWQDGHAFDVEITDYP
jgi:proteic killer suppression protein